MPFKAKLLTKEKTHHCEANPNGLYIAEMVAWGVWSSLISQWAKLMDLSAPRASQQLVQIKDSPLVFSPQCWPLAGPYMKSKNRASTYHTYTYRFPTSH